MKTILLVEDDPFLIDIYRTKLREAGFKLELATDGEEALKKVKENNSRQKPLWPDLLILDIVLPHIDGWEVLRKVRQEPAFKNLKVIILSNLGQKLEVEKGLKMGAVKYLIKAHHTPSEVVEEIKKIIK